MVGWERMSRRQRTAAAAVGAFVAVVFLISVLVGGDGSWGAGGGDALRGGVEKRWVRLRAQRRVCDADAERTIAKNLQPFVNFSMNRLMHGDGRGHLAVTEIVLREKMPGFVPLRSDIDLATRLYTADTAKVLEMLSVAPFFRALRERPGQPLQRLLRFVKLNAPAPLVFRRSVVDKFETYSDNPKKFELRTGTMVFYGSLVNGSIYQGHYLGGSLSDVTTGHHAAHTVMYRHKHRSYIIRLNKDSITTSFLQVLSSKVVLTMKAALVHLDRVSGDNPKPKPKPIGEVTYTMTVYKGSGKQDLEIAVETYKKAKVEELRVSWTLQGLGKTYYPNRVFTMSSLVNRDAARFKSFAMLPEYLHNAADHKNCRFLPKDDPRYCSWQRATTYKAFEIAAGTSCGGADDAIWSRPRQLERAREVEHNVAMMNCLCDLDSACSGSEGRASGGGKGKGKAGRQEGGGEEGGASGGAALAARAGGGGGTKAQRDYATCHGQISGGGKKKKKKKKKKGPTKCELLTPTCRTQAQKLHKQSTALEWLALSSAYVALRSLWHAALRVPALLRIVPAAHCAGYLRSLSTARAPPTSCIRYNDSKYADSPAAFVRFHDPAKLASVKCACTYSEASAFSECAAPPPGGGAAGGGAQIDAVRLWHTFGVMLPLQRQTVTMSINLVEGHLFDHLPLMHDYVMRIDKRAAEVEGLDATLGSNDIGYVANAVAAMYAADKRALQERGCDLARAKGGAMEDARTRVIGSCEGFAFSVATEQWMVRLITFYFQVFARSSNADWRASCVADAAAGNFKQLFAPSASMLALACEKMLRAMASDERAASVMYEQCIERFTLCLLPLFVASDAAGAVQDRGAPPLASARAACYIGVHQRSTSSCAPEWPEKMIACHASVTDALAVLYPHFATGRYTVSTGGGVDSRGRRFATSIIALIASLVESKSLQ